MGIFGSDDSVQMLAPDTWTEGYSGFSAMGKPVPFFRQQAGYEHAKAMGCSTENAFAVVRLMSEQIERDKPMTAMNEAAAYLDVTGIYRLLSVLLTAPEKV